MKFPDIVLKSADYMGRLSYYVLYFQNYCHQQRLNLIFQHFVNIFYIVRNRGFFLSVERSFLPNLFVVS